MANGSPFWISLETIYPHILAFIRISGLLFALPIIGEDPINVRVRIFISLGLCLLVSHMHKINLNPEMEPIALLLVISKELSLGLILGFVVRLSFAALMMSVTIVSYQMGFGTASLLVPGLESPVDAFTLFHRMAVITIFFCLNIHHEFIKSLFLSFKLLPVGQLSVNVALGHELIRLMGDMLTAALSMAAPLLVGLSITMMGLGLLARAIPQLNIFTISFPVSYVLGMALYAVVLTALSSRLSQHFGQMSEHMAQAIGLFSPTKVF